MTQSFCREQVIVFVYDTGYCQTEADDPQKAVLFFHPHWVSDQQRLALCGQLMGAAHFCSLMFSTPRVLTLQCGKFVLKKYGRYILVQEISNYALIMTTIQIIFNFIELPLLGFRVLDLTKLFQNGYCKRDSKIWNCSSNSTTIVLIQFSTGLIVINIFSQRN